MFCKLRLTCAAALALSALLPSLAGAQSPGSKVYSAFAYFYEQTEGCDLFETWLEVHERWIPLESGLTEHSTTLTIWSLHYDTCEDFAVSVVSGSAAIPNNAFRTQGLKSASVQTTVGFNERPGGEIVPLVLDLRWTCPRERVDREPNWGGTCAPLGLSGSVLLGTRELMDSPSMQGELSLRKH